MIVADTTVIASLLLPTPHTALAERLLCADPEWIAPVLWRSEMRNVLAVVMDKGRLGLEEAVALQREAEALLGDREYELPARDVLALARTRPGSGPACEFAALARHHEVPLVTVAAKRLEAFPETAVSLSDYVSDRR